ncbi:MAG: hypothetical protein QOD70_1772 [Frankiales bacterium]|jgi:hypothetical protein|nr:hypothetical protein [Frankiales bacterium]
MDTTALQAAYKRLLDTAASPDLGEAADGGWNADQLLAHLLSIDAGITAVALGVVAGSRPTFDNRVSLDRWNLARIVGEHADRAALIDSVRRTTEVLCDVADQLTDAAAQVLVPSLLLSNEAVAVDQPLTLESLIGGLASDHVPRHTQQLLELRVPG